MFCDFLHSKQLRSCRHGQYSWASLKEAVYQCKMFILSPVIGHMLFLNQQKREQSIHERICWNQGSIRSAFSSNWPHQQKREQSIHERTCWTRGSISDPLAKEADMSLVLRKLVFAVSDLVQHKPGCTTTEDS